eukprot:CAMPEP_0202017352 /NCGR_PEP_ID=MMETSP0905-20130828/36778_1 /ASSEMBLY_ACC=CAM_ASM_000554 /TAXON_ID=420261 /ORGANISM="Thalassiosira antarctica, Strain CCMP982" /LENGTH=101 /DNA_ID=CAMNT_0048577983 /DNA_START=8 /DNA_END=309 /DNA_ORIENTATION=+
MLDQGLSTPRTKNKPEVDRQQRPAVKNAGGNKSSKKKQKKKPISNANRRSPSPHRNVGNKSIPDHAPMEQNQASNKGDINKASGKKTGKKKQKNIESGKKS